MPGLMSGYMMPRRFADADFHAGRETLLRSMRGTLIHLPVTDRIWMQRFMGEARRLIDWTPFFSTLAPPRGRPAKPQIDALSPTLRNAMKASSPPDQISASLDPR